MAIPAPDASQRETSPGPSVLTKVLAGITVSLAMVPESLAFTFVAGVSPIVGLHAAALMGLCTAVLGAQPGVISGAAGATAVVFAPLVASHGPEYLFAAVALAGAIQAVVGALRLGKFIRFVPQPCMIGFVNGLAIVIAIASAQINSFAGLADAALYTQVALTALTMALIKLIPNLSFVPKQIPAPSCWPSRPSGPSSRWLVSRQRPSGTSRRSRAPLPPFTSQTFPSPSRRGLRFSHSPRPSRRLD